MDFRFSIFDFGLQRARPRHRAFTSNQQLATSNFVRLGFTFTEVMFAVILLGIGFIMVAAIFPVAIQQSQSNLEDAAGVAVAKQGQAIMSQVGQMLRQYVSPAVVGGPRYIYNNYIYDLASGKVAPPLSLFTDVAVGPPFPPSPSGYNVPLVGNPIYYALKGNFIQSSDPRYAFVPVGYQYAWNSATNQTWSYAKVYVLAVKVRSQSQYTNQDLIVNNVSGNLYGSFLPRVEYFYLTDTNQKPNLLTFVNSSTACSPAFDPPEAAEGSYVWVADDGVTGVVSIAGLAIVNPGQANGRFYRLGSKRADLGAGVWELVPGDGPGHDMTYSFVPGSPGYEVNENLPPRLSTTAGVWPPAGVPARGFIVGRGYTDPRNAAPNTFEGVSQDLIALPPITVPIPN